MPSRASRKASSSASARGREPAARYGDGASRSAISRRLAAEAAPRPRAERSRSYTAVFTRASRQLNAEMSQPAAGAPKAFASTSVVPEPANGIPHEAPGPPVAPQEDLDELRHVLPEIRMQPVDVLRPLPLGKLRLGPRQLEVDLVVESGLGAHELLSSPPRRRGPARVYDRRDERPDRSPAVTSRSSPASRTATSSSSRGSCTSAGSPRAPRSRPRAPPAPGSSSSPTATPRSPSAASTAPRSARATTSARSRSSTTASARRRSSPPPICSATGSRRGSSGPFVEEHPQVAWALLQVLARRYRESQTHEHDN